MRTFVPAALLVTSLTSMLAASAPFAADMSTMVGGQSMQQRQHQHL